MSNLTDLHHQYVDLKIANKLRNAPSVEEAGDKDSLRYEVDSRDKIEEAYYFLSSKGRDFLLKIDKFLKNKETFSNSSDNFGFLEISQVRRDINDLVYTKLSQLLAVYKPKSQFSTQNMIHLVEARLTSL